MALSFQTKKRIVIGTFSSVAASWSGATASIPVAGPLLADTAGLTVITISMAYTLSLLYDKKASAATLASFASVAFGAVMGQLALKLGASLIPIFGNFYNASVTFVLHIATGWALCEIFDSGRDLDSITSSEIKEIIKGKMKEAKKEKEKFDSAIKALSPEDQKEMKDLIRKMRNKNLTDEQRSVIMDEIIAVFERNNQKSPFED